MSKYNALWEYVKNSGKQSLKLILMKYKISPVCR